MQPGAVSSNTAAEEERRKAVQASYGCGGVQGQGGGAQAEAAQAEEEQEMKKAQLEAYEKALQELEIKAETQRGFVLTNRQKRDEWNAKVARSQVCTFTRSIGCISSNKHQHE